MTRTLPTLIFMSVFFLFALAARAETSSSSALNFKTWKEQQILTAQNRLLRLNAELGGKTTSSSPSPNGSEKVSSKEKALRRFHHTQEKSGLERLENQVKLAKDAVQNASELTLDDYITIYLPTLSQTPASIEALVDSMSREEISKILTEILKKQSDQGDRADAPGSRLTELWAGQAPANP